jgi:hypothetical protein
VTGPGWLGDGFAVVMILTAVYCAGRLALSRWRRRPTETDVDAVHVIMGVSMAGMLVPGLRVLPNGVWAVVFTGWAAWFGGRMLLNWAVSRDGLVAGARPGAWQHGQHLLASLAMLYMLLAMRTAPASPAGAAGPMGVSGSGAGRFPTLALLLTLGLLAYAIWTTDRLGSMATVAALAGDGRPGSEQIMGEPPGIRTAGPAGTAAGLSGDGQARDGRTGLREARVSEAGDGAGWGGFGVPLSPRLSACCEIAMGVTMGYLLVLML